MKRMASVYTIVTGEFYCRGYSQSLLKCVDRRYAQAIIEEMHEGICENHVGSHALTTKILRASYFWPTMKQDYLEFVQRCDKCQRFGELKHTPSLQFTT